MQIEEAVETNTHKKLIRFYFQSLEPEKLEFPQLNRTFDRKAFEANYSHSFQIYLVKFTNKINTHLLEEDENVNEIGILTCYEKEETEEMFARFSQRLEPSCQESFELRLVEKALPITKEDYE